MRYLRKHRRLFMGLVEAVFLAALCGFLLWMQGTLSTASQQREMHAKVEQLRQGFGSVDEVELREADLFDARYGQWVMTIAYGIRHGAIQATRSGLTDLCDILNAQTDEAGMITNLLVVDLKGRKLASAHDSPADFSAARFHQLLYVFEDPDHPSVTDEEYCTSWPFSVTFSEEERYRYYGAAIDENRIAVIEQDPTVLDGMLADANVWSSLFNTVNVGEDGCSFVVSKRDGTFRYHSDPELIGCDAIAAGVDVNALEDGACLWMTVNGEDLYCGVVEDEDCFAVCAITEEEFHAFNTTTVVVVLLCFFVVITAFIAYAVLLQEHRRPPAAGEKDVRRCVTVLGFKYDGYKMRRLLTGSVIGLLVVFVSAYYMQTLFSLSSASTNNAYRLQEVDNTLARKQDSIDNISDQLTESVTVKIALAAEILNARPELINDTDLNLLSGMLVAPYVAVYDENARIVATNSGYKGFRLSDDPDDVTSNFWDLYQGYDSYVDDEPKPDELQYAAHTLRDEHGVVTGIVVLAVPPDAEYLDVLEVGSVLKDISYGENGFAFAVSRETGELVYYPDDRFIGHPAGEIGLPTALLGDTSAGYATLLGERYFVSTIETNDNYICIAAPDADLTAWRLSLTLAAAGFSFVCLLLVSLLNFEEDSPALLRRAKGPEPAEPGAACSLPRWEAELTRLGQERLREDAKAPEHSVMALLQKLLMVLSVLITVTVLFAEKFYDPNSVLRYVIEGGWQRGVNIFAFTGCLLLICALYTGIILCNQILSLFSVIADARGRTICQLFGNIIKYTLVLVGVYYCLAMLGVDTATLVASAGIFSLVIGLGAQSLINDILAGLFIIFEGQFHVGDIVTIGDWRGTVTSIGLRTTRIENSYGDVKSISNHTVTGVVNRTQKPSTAKVDLFIPANCSLSAIEALLPQALPEIGRRLSAIQNGPFYRGVVTANNIGITVRFTARCAEQDRSQLTRDMTRALRLMLEQELGITATPALARVPGKAEEKTTEKADQTPAATAAK